MLKALIETSLNEMKRLLVISSLLISTNIRAHGEENFGPNKGYIRMPGSFHTELVPQMDGAFLVFLLDLQNKNPITKDSSVDLKIKNSKESVQFKCTQMEDHFHCTNDKKVTITADSKIVLKAKRHGIKAQEATYDLPLKLGGHMKAHNMSKESK